MRNLRGGELRVLPGSPKGWISGFSNYIEACISVLTLEG